jgi:hypothetical protein
MLVVVDQKHKQQRWIVLYLVYHECWTYQKLIEWFKLDRTLSLISSIFCSSNIMNFA